MHQDSFTENQNMDAENEVDFLRKDTGLETAVLWTAMQDRTLWTPPEIDNKQHNYNHGNKFFKKLSDKMVEYP